MSDYALSMSLAVRHPDIDPERITQASGLQPGHVWRKGEGRIDLPPDFAATLGRLALGLRLEFRRGQRP